MKRSRIVGLAAFGCVCILAGNKTAGDPPPDIITVTHTRTVHEAGPEKDIYIIPKLDRHCREAIAAASSVANHAGKLYDDKQKQLDILDLGRRLLADGQDTTKADEAERALMGREVGHLSSMVDALTEINLEIKLCNKETK